MLTNLKNKKFIYISIFCYLSLILGFILNEDSAGGALYDYNFHLGVRDFFLKDTFDAVKNFADVKSYHSPIFYIFLKYLLFAGETFGRLIFLHISILIPIVFYFTLKRKISDNKLFIFYISCFFFLSPYFRSIAIWPGDENLALLFFIFSIYFYFSFLKTDSEKTKLVNIALNIFFLAIASYFRPNYCFFSLFFFYEFVLKKFNFKYLIVYSLLSFMLAYPAFYYIFLMNAYFVEGSFTKFNLINSFPLTYTVIFFFLIPFLILDRDNILKNLKPNILNLSICFLLSVIVFLFFNYDLEYGGGIFYILQKKLFSGNLGISIIFFISLYLSNKILEIKNIKNLILMFSLLLFEIDTFFYMETFDPLFLICFLLLFDNKNLDNFYNKLSFKKINFIFLYLFTFYIAKVANIYIFLNKL